MTNRKAHTAITVPQEWIEAIDSWRRRQKLTMTELGKRAGAAIGQKPFSNATMSRFLAGQTTTREVAEALSAVAGIPLPASILALEEPFALWLELGQRLRQVNARLFEDELHELRNAVEALERLHLRRNKST